MRNARIFFSADAGTSTPHAVSPTPRPALPLPVELIGGSEEERRALGSTERVHLLPAIPYPEVPDVLAKSAALMLPLQDNLFGRQLTSPLKMWDYLACAAPIIAPDLPSIHPATHPTPVV